MHVEIHGLRYPISNDFDPDTGQSWTWDGEIPVCPACAETLTIRDGSRLVDVHTLGWERLAVVCECGAEQEIH